MNEIQDYLSRLYNQALAKIGSKESITTNLDIPESNHLDNIIKHSESAKGVLTVLLTSLVYKSLNPNQDIRNHQDSIPGGYSGRTFDTKYITPFLKHCKFPAMAESGWLTRSLEQKIPYNLSYPGAINPQSLKLSFLTILDCIEMGANSESYIDYIFQGLILKRNKQLIDLAKPTTLPINIILEILDKHFHSKYNSEGASRLPVLAFYAIYSCLIKELKRFDTKTLLPIESHTSADSRSGRIGDIEIIDQNNRTYEALEIKHGITISLQIVKDAYSKFQTTPVNRYYILSTAPQANESEWESIQTEIRRIKNVHGCQVIVNGLMPSLKYYLRLLENSFEFIDKYVDLIETDTALKYEHKENWNRIISQLS
jgi:DNA (cytosine-5)-methyltransferase 1